jgi:DnaK suppressor protein
MCARERKSTKSKARPSDLLRKSKGLTQREEQLRAEQNRLLGELAADSASPDELADGWQDRDSAAENELRDVEYQHRSAIRERLLKVEQALERLQDGTYGLCVKCGARIDRERLSGDPAVLRCVSCQAASEGEAPPSL